MEIAPRIQADPEKCAGKPCIRDTRVRVIDVLEMLAGGASAEEIVTDFPYLELEDIPAALTYAASQVAGPVVFPLADRIEAAQAAE